MSGKPLIKKVVKNPYVNTFYVLALLLALSIGICGLVISVVSFSRSPKSGIEGPSGIQGIPGTNASLLPCAYCNTTEETNSLNIDGSILFSAEQQPFGFYRTGNFTDITGINGSWATNLVFSYQYTRIGSAVTLQVSLAFGSGAPSGVYIRSTVPLLDFLIPRNAFGVRFPLRVQDNSVYGPGYVFFLTGGYLGFSPGYELDPFSGGSTGFGSFSMSYLID